MPDWTYHPVFRPILRRLPPHVARDATLRAIGTVARVPGGRAIVRTFGDMRAPKALACEAFGARFVSPIGYAAGIDPHAYGRTALGEFGFGFAEIVVSPRPIARGGIAEDARTRTIATTQPFENDGVDVVVARLAGVPAPTTASGFRLVPDGGSNDDAARAAVAAMRARLVPYAAFFIVAEALLPASAADDVATLVALDDAEPDDAVVAAARRCVAAGAAGVRLAIGSGAATLLRAVRAAVPADAVVLAVTTSDEPAAALAAFDAGATFVAFGTGFVFAGPLLAKRTNDALAARLPIAADTRAPYAQPWFWALALGAALAVGGVLAWIVAATRVVLPYDEVFLGWSRAELAAREPRLLAFMTHDRITLAGSMIAIGILYAGVALGDMRRGAPWAKRMFVVSAYVGLATYWLWLRFGFFDPLHALLTLIAVPFIVLATVLRLGAERSPVVADVHESRERKRALIGVLLFVVIGFGFVVGGVTIAYIGVTTVFVPTDLMFLDASASSLAAVNPHLVPLVAHDRAGFGGDLAADGLAIFLTALWGFRRGNAGLWWTIALAGIPGFGAAFGVHMAIGYMDPIHLAPPFTAFVLYVCALALTYPYLVRSARVDDARR